MTDCNHILSPAIAKASRGRTTLSKEDHEKRSKTEANEKDDMAITAQMVSKELATRTAMEKVMEMREVEDRS